MKNYLIAGAVLAASFTTASAATLNYVGETYTSVSGGSSVPCVSGCVGTVRPNGYNKSMRLEFSFELASKLDSNAEYLLSSDDLLSYEIFDGLYKRSDANPGFEPSLIAQIKTDDAGGIVSWYITYENGYGTQDSDFLRSLTRGDSVTHEREYEGPGDSEVGMLSGVNSGASTNQGGTWYYGPPPANIPLPASLPFLFTGAAVLGLIRRRRGSAKA